ncbi:mechanosensitive ion channel [Candidatus Uhrbacteria bacterium]|nr:mechanosensitive ion channel [Candidatus Uhrbacteria bacterium]
MKQFIDIGIIIAVSFVLYWCLRFFHGKLVAFLLKNNSDESINGRIQTIGRVIMSTGMVVISALTLIMTLKTLGIDPTPLLASAGIAGLALSFGAQSLVKDVISGLFILIENQFSEGDEVTLDDKNGKVVCVSLRKTVLKDNDGTIHHVPHGHVRIVSVRAHKR